MYTKAHLTPLIKFGQCMENLPFSNLLKKKGDYLNNYYNNQLKDDVTNKAKQITKPSKIILPPQVPDLEVTVLQGEKDTQRHLFQSLAIFAEDEDLNWLESMHNIIGQQIEKIRSNINKNLIVEQNTPTETRVLL